MKTDEQAENFGNSELTIGQAPKNGSSVKVTADNSGSTSLVPKATDPRTQQGKERSKHNAITHAIFSKVVVLEGNRETKLIPC